MHHEADVTAAFLSGNGPLVQVLREALVRDAPAASGASWYSSRVSCTSASNVRPEVPEAEPRVLAVAMRQRASEVQ
jgi:hypothetical protein